MGPRAAVFCHNGLGDGVVSLVLSNNLHLNGWSVDTYHNLMRPLQNWFPHLPVLPYPTQDVMERILHDYQWFFVFQNDTNEFTKKLIAEGKRRYPDQVKVIYIYPSKYIINEPYYLDAQIDPKIPVAENLRVFCEKILHLPKSTCSNGFIPPPDLQYRYRKERVLFHPTGSRPGKIWDKSKFINLAIQLKREGYEPILAMSLKEREEWLDLIEKGFDVPEFHSFDALARFVYESGFLIGNDSGLGHLASFLGVPTLTISRRKALAKLWAPSFAPGVVVTPGSWVPNIRGMRLRDRYWQKFITTERVLRAFNRLASIYCL